MNTDPSIFLSIIFEDTPEQWGLRGDPYLWEDMKQAYSTVPVTISQEEFVKSFEMTFEKMTGTPLTPGRHVFLPEYAHGGMSGGKISGDFWIEKALPLLLERLKNIV